MRYLDLDNLTKSQIMVMTIVEDWVHSEKTPVPHGKIMKTMKERGGSEGTIKDAINSLIKKCYLRRAVVISNKSYYVQLRRI